jgi:hypothetical protein
MMIGGLLHSVADALVIDKHQYEVSHLGPSGVTYEQRVEVHTQIRPRE